MKNETQIRTQGMDTLIAGLGRADAERFIRQIVTDRSDYTKWREYLFHGMTLEEINSEAQALWEKNGAKEKVS